MLVLNAYTNGFYNCVSSNGCIVPRFVQWVYFEPVHDGITVFEDSWMYHPDIGDVQTQMRVGWLQEARSLRPENYDRAMSIRHKFDLIMTYDDELLSADPDKFKLVPRMGLHITPDLWGIHNKTKHIAMIVSGKNTTEGHKLRHEIASRYSDQIDIYGSKQWADKATVYKDYCFVIVVEPSRTKNYFTEHLLDAIAMGCIPLYWGATNVDDFLNGAGILQWSTLDDLDNLIKTVNLGLYNDLLVAAKDNFSKLPGYGTPEDWAYTHIFKALGF